MKPRKAISFFDFQPEYMSTLTITSASVITAQPVRLDFDVWMTVRSGNIRIGTDVIATDIPCSSFSVFSSGKIIEIEQVSDDFEADLFLLSKKFQDDLSIGEMLSLKLRFNLSPTIQMDGEAMEALADYHRMARRISSLNDNPRKWESLIHLTKAFYYGGGYYFFSGANRPHNEDSILTRFISLVEQNALRQRDTAYYAGRLCLTPKYLSRLIKQKTGRTAKEVILNYVSLRSKTLLLNTDLTIQQVADETGFPSQSVFGKFFKRSTGLSPREYRTRHQ